MRVEKWVAVITILISSRCEAADLAYVVNFFSSNISVIDGSSAAVVTTIPFDANNEGPVAVTASADGFIYAAVSGEQNSVAVIDPGSQSIIRRIPLSISPTDLAASRDGSRVYVLGGASPGQGVISVIDTRSARVIQSISTDAGAEFVTPGDVRIYVTYGGVVSAIDLHSGVEDFAAEFAEGEDAYGLALSLDERQLFVVVTSAPGTGPGGKVEALNANDGSLIDTFAVGADPFGIALSPDGRTLYVANTASDSVSIVDTVSKDTTEVPVGSEPIDVGVSGTANLLYVSNRDSDTVSIIDLQHPTRSHVTVNVGNMPTLLAVADATFGTPTPSPTAKAPSSGGCTLESRPMSEGAFAPFSLPVWLGLLLIWLRSRTVRSRPLILLGIAATGAWLGGCGGGGAHHDVKTTYAIATIAGNGTRGLDVRTGPALEAQFYVPYAITLGGDGTLYIADDQNGVRALRNGEIQTLVAPELIEFADDIAISSDNALYFTGRRHGGSQSTIYRYDLASASLTDWYAAACAANVGSVDYLLCDKDLAVGLGVRRDEVLVRTSIAPGDQIFDLPAHETNFLLAGHGEIGFGFGLNEGGAAQGAAISHGGNVAVDSNGDVYFSDVDNCRVRQVDSNGLVHTIAGGGGIPIAQGQDVDCGHAGDGGPAADAHLLRPGTWYGIAFGNRNEVFISDGIHVRRVSPSGIIDTIAGTGEQECVNRNRCCPGDGGPAIDAGLGGAMAMAVSPSGDIYLAESGGACPRIRILTPNRN